MYVSDPYENVVNLYSPSGSNQAPVGQIGGFNQPQGMWVDAHRNLWVSNTNSQTVLAFHNGHLFPYKTLTDPNGYPAGVCGNRKTGTVYAPDILSPGNANGQTVNVYAGGSTTPTSVLTEPNSQAMYECALDSHGNLFVTFSDLAGYGDVDEFINGQGAPVTIISGLIYPIGVTLDKYNTLSVDDTGPKTISLYNPPYTGAPFYSYSTPGYIIQTVLDPTQAYLWGADSSNVVADQFTYPYGVLQNQTSSAQLTYPDGIALSPSSKP